VTLFSPSESYSAIHSGSILNDRSSNVRMIALLQSLHNDECGQGLVEYLLMIALVALAATAGMSSAASYINSAFIRVGGKLGSYIS
jgi:Flp pilus assembly pilin Flp